MGVTTGKKILLVDDDDAFRFDLVQQPFLGLDVIGSRAVKVEMIRLEVGENARVKLDPCRESFEAITERT